MSLWKPTKYGHSGREMHWLNLCIGSHDLMCGCDEPAEHLLILLAKKSGFLKISKEALIKSTKCLTSGEDLTHETTGEDEDETGLEPGELDRLFAEEGDADTG